MTSQQIRQMWLDFFASKNHELIKSASLIPHNDPTLLWINAGIAPLKKYFDGTIKPDNPRLANLQKCLRTNDIDEVGRTARHHTFFEMMGNFSIGEYFKKEAIAWALELLTDAKWFGFPQEKLYITYHPSDIEARDIWLSLGIDPAHLIAFEGNFWEIGPGPCGPNTEIFYDRGPAYDPRGVELIREDINNDRYVEIWNIVFSQYNAEPGVAREDYKELPFKNIDTGAGLERFACVIQETETNFETDLFLPIIAHLEKLSGIPYEGQMAYKVIADHVKALVFTISDGAMLSNEGRGYVLRRLLRRAVKYGRDLGLTKPFLHLLVDDVVDVMKIFYDSLPETKTIVKKIILQEEEKFMETINEGEKHFFEALEQEPELISGTTAFKLYDTYGFPIELTMEYAEEQGITVDIQGFEEELKKQKERSRQARSETSSMHAQKEAHLNFLTPSTFVGYETLQTEATIIKVFPEGIVLDQTPFYATSGGQIHDSGTINGLVVTDVVKLPHGQHLHQVEGDFTEGETVLAIVDQKLRNQTIKNHSAVHLYHQALRETLGNHVFQQGSYVSPTYWRFDFNHFETIDDSVIVAIEEKVKQHIMANPLAVTICHLPLEEAKALGAIALFGEKYSDIVRVVDMGWSKELCGGTHVSNTKEIGDFAIYQYESIGSGIYRMEGIAGEHLNEQMQEKLANYEQEVETIKEKIIRLDPKEVLPLKPKIKGSYQDIVSYRHYLDDLKNQVKEVEKRRQEQYQKDIFSHIDDFITDPNDKKPVILTNDLQPRILKQLIDTIYDKIKADVVLLINQTEEKATFICKSRLNNAHLIIKEAAALTKGSGGGNPQMAQGGTQNVALIDQMIEAIKKNL